MKMSRVRIACTLAGWLALLSTSACASLGYGSAGHTSPGSSGSSGYGSSQPGYGSPQPGGDAPAAAPQGGSPVAARSTLNMTMSGQLGPIVTDAAGYTLYRFDKDTSKPPNSNCEAQCAKKWPPALATGPITVNGIDQSAVGTVKRSDGTMQLTLGGWPLYRYAQDGPGDVKGENVGGVWYATTPSGKKAQAPAGGGQGTGNPSDGSYGRYGG